MDGRPIWTDCVEAGDYVVPNVLSPRDLVFRPDNMDETVPHSLIYSLRVCSQKPYLGFPIYFFRLLDFIIMRSPQRLEFPTM